jgi:hypothetical protein
MNKGWRQPVVIGATAFFGFVVFSPETFAYAPWLIALAKFAMAGGLAALGIAAHTQAKANAAAIQQVDEKVTDTHAAINGRMEELIQASNSQGRQEQRAETRQDARDALAP